MTKRPKRASSAAEEVNEATKAAAKKASAKKKKWQERRKAEREARNNAEVPKSDYYRDTSEEAEKKRKERVKKLKDRLKGKTKADGTAYEYNPRFTKPQPGRCNAVTSMGGYCGMWAGFRTDHPGVGQCYVHQRNAKVNKDGGAPIGATRKARYSYLTNSRHIARLRRQEDELEDLLDLSPELKLMRVLLEDIVENWDMWSEALEEWWRQEMPGPRRPRGYMSLTEVMDALDKIGRQAERIQKMKMNDAINVFVLHQYLEAAGAYVVEAMQSTIQDPVLANKLMEKIEHGWSELPLIDAYAKRAPKSSAID